MRRLLFLATATALLALTVGCGGPRFADEAAYLSARQTALVAKNSEKQEFTRDDVSFYLWNLESRQAIVDRVEVVGGAIHVIESLPFSDEGSARAWLLTEERADRGTQHPVSIVRSNRTTELGATSSSMVGSSPGGPLYAYTLPSNVVVVDIPASDALGGITITESREFANLIQAQGELGNWTDNHLEWIQQRSEALGGATLDWARTLTEFQLYGWKLPDGTYTLDIADPDTPEGVLVFRSEAFGSVDEVSAYADRALLDDSIRWAGGLQFSKSGWMLIGTVLLVGAFIIFNILRAKKGKTLTIRRIAGLDQIDEAIGRATETARPVLMVPGIGVLDGISVQALTVFGSVIRSAARFATPIRLLTANPAVFGVAQEIARDVYLSEGVPEQFDPDSVRFVSDRQFAFASGVAGIIQRERVAAAFFMGEFFAESMIFAENANIVGAIQVAASTQTTQTPFFIAACDYVLLGDEFYAASAYLGRQPVLLGSLIGVDWSKMLFMAFILGAVVIHSYNQIRPVDPNSLTIEERTLYEANDQKYIDWRTDTWFLKLTREKRQ